MGDTNYGDKFYDVDADSIGQVGDNYYVTIHEGQKKKLPYSDPWPNISHFQGRVSQRKDLHEWLSDPAVSLIGVKGEGGIGKSTLTAKVFADCAGFGGKCWVDVRSGTTLSGVARSALQEFGGTPEEVEKIEEKDLPKRLLTLLQSKRCLLAIDNLESVLGGDGVWQSGYEEFLDGFQELGGESVILLAGREYPKKYRSWRKVRWLEVDQGLEPGEGAALLGALEAEGTEAERSAVSVQVKGNPLALALLAGWLRQFRVGERSVVHLAEQPDWFRVEGTHRLEKEISVERVFDWSFDRLTPTAQELLTQVSVLRGGFNHEAAGALVRREVADRELQDLERRSLLQELPERDRRGQLGYRLQPRVQDFARKRNGDLTQAHERAIQHFWSQRQTEFAPTDTEDAAQEYLETYYHECQLGRYQPAFQTVFACDKFLRRRGYLKTLADLYVFLHTTWQLDPEDRSTYAAICNNLGLAYYSLGQYERSIDLHQQSLVIAREIGDRGGEAASLGNLGCAYNSLGQYERAIDLHQQSLVIAREIGDRCREANALGNMGNAYGALGQYEQAINFCEKQRAITQRIGDRGGEANSLGSLGNVYRSLGQYERAINFYEKQRAITRRIGDRGGEATCLGNLGCAYRSLGQYERAIDLHQQSLVIAREIGDRGGEANSLGSLGNAYDSLGQYERAIALYQQSLVIQQEIGDRNGEATSLFNQANSLGKLDQHFNALQCFQQALAIYTDLKLAHMVEQCKAAITQCSQIIPAQRPVAPTIKEKPPLPDWYLKSLPNATPSPQTSSRPLPLWLWFALGLAGALLVWWLKR